MKKKVLFITNIPSPYRIDFFNLLGEYVDLTVVFEARTAVNHGINFNWNTDTIRSFSPIFLSDNDIEEKKIDKKIFSILKTLKNYDEVFLTSYAYYTEMTAYIYARMFHIPHFVEIDGGLVRNESRFVREIKRFLIGGAKGYFSPSLESDRYLKHYGAKDDIMIRYPFTSLSNADVLKNPLGYEDRNRIRRELGIKEKKVIIGIGQFIHRKGFDILIRSMKLLDEEYGLYLIGGKDNGEYGKLRDELGLKNVTFLEFMTKEELSAYYKAADLFVLPTREDIWGLVINEAMAHGLPVITTEKCIAGLEMVRDGENGFIVPIENVEALAERISEVLKNDSLREKMSEECLLTAREYTIEKMVEAHMKVLS